MPQIKESDTLRVLTLYSSTSYFLHQDSPMGYQYELASQFAQDHELQLKLIVCSSISDILQKLDAGEGDMVAFPISHSFETKKAVKHCGYRWENHQVVVQNRNNETPIIDNVTELIGKEVYVEKGTRYETRIKNLNNELGGGIRIYYIDRDTLSTEELITLVARGDIAYTLADRDLAQLNKTYYNHLDIRLKVSFGQQSSWIVRHDQPLLAEAIDNWAIKNVKSPTFKSVSKRYFEQSKNRTMPQMLSPKEGRISIYDDLFKKYAPQLGWEWQQLAALAYTESQFDASAVSWVGARGLMQIMPHTARNYGFDDSNLDNPEENVKAAVALLKDLNSKLSSIEDKAVRIYFVLAAYNTGLGHIYDAQALAVKYGKSPKRWTGHVAEFVALKRNPEYYNDPVCKYGYLRGNETLNFVKDVLDLNTKYMNK